MLRQSSSRARYDVFPGDVQCLHRTLVPERRHRSHGQLYGHNGPGGQWDPGGLLPEPRGPQHDRLWVHFGKIPPQVAHGPQ